jgi:hypothetical protein
MPSAQIISESLVMRERGWEMATTQGKARYVFGTDRHGKIVAKEIAVESLGSSGIAVFLGTEACFGMFAAETALVNKAGQCLTARALAESNELAESWFENVVAFPFSASEADLGLFSSALVTLAPFATESCLARRCTSREVALSASLGRFCSLQKVSNDLFLITDRKGLEGAKLQKLEIVVQLASVICRSTDDDGLTFEAADAALAAWYCSALATNEEHYQVSYDSLQHSLFAKVQKTKERQSPFKNARCGYLEQHPREKVRIVWDDSSWSPIVNGFLVKGI